MLHDTEDTLSSMLSDWSLHDIAAVSIHWTPGITAKKLKTIHLRTSTSLFHFLDLFRSAWDDFPLQKLLDFLFPGNFGEVSGVTGLTTAFQLLIHPDRHKSSSAPLDLKCPPWRTLKLKGCQSHGEANDWTWFDCWATVSSLLWTFLNPEIAVTAVSSHEDRIDNAVYVARRMDDWFVECLGGIDGTGPAGWYSLNA